MPKCKQCGADVGPEEKECPSCHAPVDATGASKVTLEFRGHPVEIDRLWNFEIFDKNEPGQMPILTVVAKNDTDALEKAYRQLKPSARGNIYAQKVTYGEAEKGRVGLLFKSTIEQVVGAIAHETEAIDDYAELENRFRADGLTAEADTTNEIRNDEVDHLGKFMVMLKKLSGSC